MANIGEPQRRHQVIPVKHPVVQPDTITPRPQHGEPAPSVPQPAERETEPVGSA
jgi:hypothetical protein